MTMVFSFDEFLSASGDVAYDWDLRTDRLVWLGTCDKLFGVGVEPPCDSENLYKIMCEEDRCLVFGTEESKFDRHYRLRRADFSYVWVHERGASESENGLVVRQRGILRLVDKSPDKSFTHNRQSRDALTGCMSRNEMLVHMGRAMEAAKAARRTSAYFVVGIDKMSAVNEAVGAEAGDALLRGVAERLSQIMPPSVLIGRVGGDIFGLLLPEPLGNDLVLLTERVLQSFRDQPVMTAVTPLHITVSIGGVCLPSFVKNATEAMIFAEQAFHDVHQRGHNLFMEYVDSPERAQDNRKLLELGERIKHAFKHDGFRLAYQPVIETATGNIVCYEALVRMFGDDGKPISAAEFVPAIEQIGLAFDLDRLVLDMAVKEMEAYPTLSLAVNVSGLTAAQANWTEHMRCVLAAHPDVASRMIVEITETAAIVDVSETKRFVEMLRDYRARASLDDFGAGFTSIRHLRSLDLSIMKIDKDLLYNVLTSPEQQHLVRILIELARGLNLKTVAEGVETEEVAAWLREAKVDMMQGYFFGKPLLERV